MNYAVLPHLINYLDKYYWFNTVVKKSLVVKRIFKGQLFIIVIQCNDANEQ